MASELFRREVVEARRERLTGEVTLTTTPSSLALTALLAATVFAAGLGLSFGSYARKVTVAGWITTDKGLARVTATGAAVISSVHVGEGEAVAKGAALVTLTQETGLASGGGAIEEALAALTREEEALDERRDLTAKRFAATRGEFEAQIAQRAAEIETLRAQAALQTERVATSAALLNRLKELESEGAAAGLEIDRQRDAAIAERQRANDIARALLAAEGELAKSTAALAKSPGEEAAALAEFEGARAGLEGRRAGLQRALGETLRAPIAGTVALLPAREGASLAPGALVAAILPEGGELEAELFVASRAAGFIVEGQRVRVKFDAFPYQKFGWGEGEVARVSKTIYRPEDLPVDLGLKEPVFRVAVKLTRASVGAYGEEYPLQPGMTLTADIVQERRALWRLLADPLPAAGKS